MGNSHEWKVNQQYRIVFHGTIGLPELLLDVVERNNVIRVVVKTSKLVWVVNEMLWRGRK